MKPRLWLLALVPVGTLLYLGWQGKPSSAVAGPEKISAPRGAAPAAQYVGAGSCSASACHNSGFTHDTKVGEYTTWITRDPHARAYAVLFDERSKRIQKNLGSATHAHDEQRCLKCHVGPEYNVNDPPPASYFKTDGVTCESCHGPAKDWINHHHLDAWQFKSASEKKELGMTDTQSLLGRAQMCVRCHVGEAGMDVDHDLIAAGHPRLNFEFSAFHAHMPRHWPDEKDRGALVSPQRGGPDFDVRAWALGQLVTAQASLELLADRARDAKKPWPEFAEHDCTACHHDLQSASARQTKEHYNKRKPGAFPWGNYVTMTRQTVQSIQNDGDSKLMKRLDDLHEAMNAVRPNRQTVAAHAQAAAVFLKPWQEKLKQTPYSQQGAERLFVSLVAKKTPNATGDLDEATQYCLSLAALLAARGDMKLTIPARLPESLSSLRQTIERTKTFDPAAFHSRLLTERDFVSKKER